MIEEPRLLLRQTLLVLVVVVAYLEEVGSGGCKGGPLNVLQKGGNDAGHELVHADSHLLRRLKIEVRPQVIVLLPPSCRDPWVFFVHPRHHPGDGDCVRVQYFQIIDVPADGHLLPPTIFLQTHGS